MSSLKDFDKSYVNSLLTTYDQLITSFNNITNSYKFDLSQTEITEAVLERLKAYYFTQGKIKIFLGKKYIAAGSDFFVESVLFFLNLYFQSNKINLSAFSERQIKRTKNSIRPDISIWRQDEVIAVIECKTQLGWNRQGWEQQFHDRHLKLKNEFPNAQSFLLVMTGSNWGGFGTHIDLNNKFFCLLNDIWPNEYSNPKQILTPLEGLFRQLK